MVISFKIFKPPSSEIIASQIQQDFEVFIEGANQEAKVILPVLRAGRDLPTSNFHFLVVQRNEIITWNDSHFIPTLQTLTDEFDLKFLKLNNEEFVIKKWKIDTERFLIGVFPLHVQYKIVNKYLAPYWNRGIFKIKNVSLVEPNDIQGLPIFSNQNVIFRVVPLSSPRLQGNLWSGVNLVFFSLAIVSLAVLLINMLKWFERKYPLTGFLLLLCTLVAFRTTMIFYDFPGRFIDSLLFDPKNFASSYLNPSLGDLLLNTISVFLLCLYLVRNYFHFNIFQYCLKNTVASKFLAVLCVSCVLFGMLFPFVVTQTIYNNSNITLSISQTVHFDWLRITALATVLLAWLSAFLFMHVFIRLLMQSRSFILLVISITLGSAVFIGINRLSGQPYFWSFFSAVVYLVSCIVFSLYRSLQKFRYTTFAYFFVAVVCLALNGMWAIRYFEQERMVENQIGFASNFLGERDYFGEYLLNEARDRISSDALIRSRMTNPFMRKESIEQKIREMSLSGYFNQYNINVSLYNATGGPLDGVDTTSFSTLINQFNNASFATEYEGVYFVSTPRGEFSRKYVVLIPIQKSEATVGYVFISLLLKRVIPENVYPELLVDSRFQKGYRTEGLSYAIAVNERVQYSTGDYNYDSFAFSSLNDPRLYSEGLVIGKHLHIAMEDGNGSVAIISSPVPPRIYWLADFSFLVILGITVILLSLLFQSLFNFSVSRNMYFAAKLQLALNLAFFIPLIAVSIITLNVTTHSSQEELNLEFLSKVNRFGNALDIAMTQLKNDPAELENKFSKLAVLANLDANLFYPTGKLITTTQPLIFEKRLLSPYINPAAFKRIRNGEKAFVATENVGKLKFYIAYAALFSQDTGEQTGILAIPFFQSAASIDRMQIAIFSNILSIFTLVFLALLVVSFFVTRWLTAPLKVIAETIGSISLTRVNKPLKWKSEDEIGLLVHEYNQMLLKLQDSKSELERNQRERAWREIAQQVAHEIKNPLTPMKLTLQQLERSLENEGQQDDRLYKVVQVLLSQVNSLDGIASSFSSFAKMPEPVMSRVELVKLLIETTELHSHSGTVLFESKIERATVLADEQLLKRVFSNLVLNGLQAARTGACPEIYVRLKMDENRYQISISDNGKGIDPELVDKIFLPHFTTKQSGSGLGLAISKQGIEQMNGAIRFETSRMGTIFIVELPAA